MFNKKILFPLVFGGIVAFLIVNGICFFYKHMPRMYDREANATEKSWNPGSFILQSSEGFGFYKIDKNGYINNTTPDEVSAYILSMGASHTEGKEVSEGYRYTDLLNGYLQKEGVDCFVYNMGHDSNFFSKIAEGFSSAIREFPYSKAITIELSELDISKKDYEMIIKQRPYDENQKVELLAKNASIKSKLFTLIKEWTPFINVVKTTFANFNFDYSNVFGFKKIFSFSAKQAESGTQEIDYYTMFYEVLKLMKGEYKNEIIIIFHPSLNISSDGIVSCVYPDTYDEFEKACQDNDVILCDVGFKYIQLYEQERLLPRGFNNTSMGTGHINKTGHKIIADTLLPYLMEVLE